MTAHVTEPLGINGLGRIGKLTLWHHAARKRFPSLVVNTGRPVGRSLEAVCGVIEKDSTYGPIHRFLHGVDAARCVRIVDHERNLLEVDGTPVTVLQKARNPRDLDWRAHGVRVVVDTTGAFSDPTVPEDDAKGALRGHLAAGAEVAINSAAFKIKEASRKKPEDATTLIYGVNHERFRPGHHRVVSAASCTTTALAHMMKPLLDRLCASRFLTASMSTIHAATNSQSVLDSVPGAGDKDLRKHRSALNSIVLTSTNAARALEEVLPELAGIGFMADSVRIPLMTESMIILNLTLRSELTPDGQSTITREVINGVYRATADGTQRGRLIVSDEQNVPADLLGMRAAVVIEACETHTRTGFLRLDAPPPARAGGTPPSAAELPVTHARIYGWYDNEYGSYTNMLGDLTCHIRGTL